MKPNNSLFSRLFPAYFLISLIGLTVVLLISRFAFKNFYYIEVTNHLTSHAKIIQNEITSLLISNNFEKLHKRVKEISKLSRNRVTIISKMGIVVSDSSFLASKMKDHSNRIEFKEALNDKTGVSTRFSPTLKKKFLYVAIPLKYNNKIIGVLRNAVSLEQLDLSLFNLTKNIIFWSFILLIALTYFIYHQAKKVSTPIENLNMKLKEFANNNYTNTFEIEEYSIQEIVSLNKTISLMSKQIKSQFNKINKHKDEQIAIFSSMLEGVVSIYPDFTINHINHAAINLFKSPYTEKQLKGKSLKELINNEKLLSKIKELLIYQNPIDDEFTIQRELTLNVHGTIINSNQSTQSGAVLVFEDITKLRQLESHRKDFVANVSHELKTPLTAIQGYVETLLDEDIKDANLTKNFLKIISKHSLRLKTIIEDLLTLSSMEKDTTESGMKLVPVNILNLINNVKSLLADKAHSKSIEVLVTGEQFTASANKHMLEQAVFNLLDNAIKYSNENSTVFINLNKSDSRTLQISIKDSGIGIDETHHKRLFERFYSADKARSRELGGSGLGLSIVKHIVLAHKGQVSVKSQLGSGSEFIIELPLD